ncbi:MAG TPA: hypothetical protein VFC82_10355 [Actinomycetaceae bacterium]|nr:hypothetical protein [Actinomycetaceae bacterium]
MTFPDPSRWIRSAPAIILSMMLVACSGTPAADRSPSAPDASVRATPCGAIAEEIVDAIQLYVDSFAGIAAGDLERASTIGVERLQIEADRLRSKAGVEDCSQAELTDLVRAELARLRGGTAVQDAVAETFRADPLGTVDPSDAGADELTVTTADELVDAVNQAGSNSVITMSAGRYELESPLIVLRPLTLAGAGVDDTTITSGAAGATLVSVVDGDVQLHDLTVEHTGELGAHVVMVAQGGYDLQHVHISGARVADDTGGFGIVLQPNRAPLDSQPTSQRLADVTLADNSAGGLVVAGHQTPTIQSLTVTGTDGCALCYVEDAAGAASDVTVIDAGIGVRVDQRAAPTLTGLDSTDAQVGLGLTGSGAVKITDARLTGGAIGVQATGSGTLDLVRARISDPSELGVRLSGTTTTTLDDIAVSAAVPVAIAVVGQAGARISGGSISTSGDAGVVWDEQATGSVAGLRLSGQRLGIQLAGAAQVDLTDVTTQGAQAALVAAGTTSGTVSRLVCGEVAVVLGEQTSVRVVDSPSCPVIRE